MSTSATGTTSTPQGVHLVTGATGFIGRNLVRKLTEDGVKVRALSRSGASFEEAGNVEYVAADILDASALEKAMRGVEVVYHLAGVGSPTSALDCVHDMYSVNVVGTHRVLDAAQRAGARRVIATSSASVYGRLDSAAIPEDAPLAPVSSYGLTKIAQERVCGMYARERGMDCIALRLFNVYGPGEDFAESNRKLIPSIVRSLRANRPISVFGNGDQVRDFVHVEDVVNALLRASTGDSSGFHVYNIGSGYGLTVIEVVNRIAKALQVEPNLERKAERTGEVKQSVADIKLAEFSLGFVPRTAFAPWLEPTASPTVK